MAQHQCQMCKYLFDEALGEPLEDIPPETVWEDVPDSFKCPVCRVKKQYFDEISE